MRPQGRPRATLTVIALGAAILLAGWASWIGVDRLAEEHHRLATLGMMAQAGARPAMPLLPDNMAFAGNGRSAAEAAFERRLKQAAASHRLLVERLEIRPVQPDRPALLAADIALSGRESDITGFARIIESGRPAVRFGTWRIARTGPGASTVRIEAGAIALWEAAT